MSTSLAHVDKFKFQKQTSLVDNSLWKPNDISSTKKSHFTATANVAGSDQREPNTPKFQIGTKVRKGFGTHGYFSGMIAEIDMIENRYKVCFGRDHWLYFAFDDRRIDILVRHAETDFVFEENEGQDAKMSDTTPRATPMSKEPTVSTELNDTSQNASMKDGMVTEDNKEECVPADDAAAVGNEHQTKPTTTPSTNLSRRSYNMRESTRLSRKPKAPSTPPDVTTGKTSGTLGTRNSRGRPLYELGTKVKKLFPGHGWFDGEITFVDINRRMYLVLYSDGDQEEFLFHSAAMDKVVRQAARDATTSSDEVQDDTTLEHDKSEEVVDQGDNNDCLEPPTKKGRYGPHGKISREPLLTVDQREQLQGIDIDVNGFQAYMVDVEDQEDSFNKIKRRVEMLKKGEGIRYKHWGDNVVFHPHPFTDLSEDFYRLRQEAIEHEEKYGKDFGNGWLLQIPLQKLENYQAYYFFSRGSPKTDKASPTTTEETKPTTKEEKPRIVYMRCFDI